MHAASLCRECVFEHDAVANLQVDRPWHRHTPWLSGIKMTTAAPAAEGSLSLTNVTNKSQEQVLYQSSGAIVAAIVVGVIVIFTVVLLLLKMYNRRMRTQRELEPKNTKATILPALAPGGNSPGRNPTVTFVPVDIHMPNRRP
nr:PREDICTED: noncompact myelin-associated protein isoform X1 [Anolis carolinensis]|eukprot:XP_016852782.1 PREDICTED: noncompact myelin-associated protein isoform X1 [Anolis carolinensis]